MANPELLLMDEVSLGLAPVVIKRIYEAWCSSSATAPPSWSSSRTCSTCSPSSDYVACFRPMWALLLPTSTTYVTYCSRVLGQWSTVGWVMLVGLVLVVPLAVLEVGGPGPALTGPDGVTGRTWGLLLVVGLGNVLGLVAAYAAFRVGKVGSSRR